MVLAVRITGVQPRSHGARAGIRPGDTLVSINGFSVSDLLDYRFYSTERSLTLKLARAGGQPYSLSLKKGQYDDLGLEFESFLMDKQRSCKNKCVFCFIDQLPSGLRESLYFKDDDDRLSFLFGNFVTMTNLTSEEIDRIIKMRISPINISVHTTNPALRVKMMKNPAAATSLEYIPRLTGAGIRVNAQIVLCPGYNDGPELLRTLEDLGALGENLQGIAVVPVGLSDYREGLPPLRLFTPAEAGEVIDLIEDFGTRMLAARGERVAHPADEFFLLAGRPIPPAGYYGGFEQLEDGVGLMAYLEDEFRAALEDTPSRPVRRRVSLATGLAAGDYLKGLCALACERFPGLEAQVHPIPNRLFGRAITVAGLVSGGDILSALEGRELGEELLFPSCMLRKEGDLFLDDRTPGQLEKALGLPLRAVPLGGWEMLDALLGQ